MNNLFYSYLSNTSGLIALIFGLIRFRKVLTAYHPFIYFIFINFFTDFLFSVIKFLKIKGVTGPVSNIYPILEISVLIWLFYRLHSFYGRRHIMYALLTFAYLGWVCNNLFFNTLKTTNGLNLIFVGICILFLSINHLNKVMVSERRSLLKNADFVICGTFIIYFAISVICDCFYLNVSYFSNDFYVKLTIIYRTTNLIANLLYAYAMLCLPTKKKFILSY